MRNALRMSFSLVLACCLQEDLVAQERPPSAVVTPAPTTLPVGTPVSNTSFIDAEGTAHVTRVVPVSPVLSPAASRWMARQNADALGGASVEQMRAFADESQARTATGAQALYPTKLAEGTIGGVSVRIVTPLIVPEKKRDRVLICLHAGGFIADFGTATESIPIANLTQTKVVAVRYSLMPEHPFPAALNDVLAVYRELLKTHKPWNIGIYGTSAGATLTAEVAVRLRQLHLPLPAALGVLSGWGDFARSNDSLVMFGLMGLSGQSGPECSSCDITAQYPGSTDRHDPVLSPLFADLKGLPPTLFLTSTRDLLLSGTSMLHRAFLNAGVPAELIVFEGLPHAFWAAGPRSMPEAIEANHLIAAFLDRHVGQKPH